VRSRREAASSGGQSESDCPGRLPLIFLGQLGFWTGVRRNARTRFCVFTGNSILYAT
jgi:hypothetical protein